ncbi:hypothetical protein TRFO_29752 [Tritrichomonas foetus]|uniref:Uncharacterized protein n=1 Tax=Tritrichomonas foetus TaxID=1144522 RepID=A0A1J4JV21_9EUKA|nr:hypothetical protein TRFO_29752 [Tritrichomonas foetus]|eukprot:OHT02993.1 hypothetical protein TRFO_29752 [Tritrichomonas foetus]
MNPHSSYRERLDALEKSNRFPKAGALKKLLEEDNQKLFKFIDDGDDLKDVPMNDIGGEDSKIKNDEPMRQVQDSPDPQPQNDYQSFPDEDD